VVAVGGRPLRVEDVQHHRARLLRLASEATASAAPETPGA
jgi:hypothetical protein